MNGHKTAPRSWEVSSQTQLTYPEIPELVTAADAIEIAGPSGAAAKLGIPRQTLDSRIDILGINKTASNLSEHFEFPIALTQREVVKKLRMAAIP